MKNKEQSFRTWTELEKAQADMQRFSGEKNWFGYKQAKAHYEKLLKRERKNIKW